MNRFFVKLGIVKVLHSDQKLTQVISGNSNSVSKLECNKKLSYCWETVRRESMPMIAEVDVEIDCSSLLTFKKYLKTYLFSLSY